MRPFLLIILLSIGTVTSSKCTNVVTFNTGLTRSVPNYETRRFEIADALLELDADVVCLQEVWKEDDLKRILQSVSSVYPYRITAFFPIGGYELFEHHRPVGRAACSDSDIRYLNEHIMPCAAATGCLAHIQISGEETLACLVKTCGHILNNGTFHADCLSCIAVTSPPTSVFFQDCTRNPQHYNRLNGPGLVLLSKRLLQIPKSRRFFEGRRMLLPRGYLTAVHIDLGRLVCTHLSSTSGPYLEYDLLYGNYEAQLREEANQLVKQFPENINILLGDLNTGPKIDNLDPEKNLAPDDSNVYNFLMTRQYKAPYMSLDARCTFCKSNPLVVNGTTEVIDHILLKNQGTGSVTYQRVLDKIPLSDHYGVYATLCP